MTVTAIKHGSPEWHQLRALRIGASEIAAVLGKDRYCSPVQLFMRKRMPQRRADPEDHRDWGSDMEPAILRNYTRRNGYELLPSPGLLTLDKLHLCATPDGLGVRNGRVRDIQAKNVEEHHTREWGEPGTAMVPIPYVAQVTVELGMLRAHAERQGLPWMLDDDADVAVSFGGRPPLGYTLPFDAELFGNLHEAAARFVHDYLIPDKVPPLAGDVAALEYVRRRFATTTGEMRAASVEEEALVAKLRTLKAALKVGEAAAEQIQAELCRHIGEAYGLEGLCTWAPIPELRQPVTTWSLVLESLIVEHHLDREKVRALIATFTRDEVIKNAYRRLSLAKERSAT